MGVIGPAQEFWRLRVVRVDSQDEPDLEWRDDVLYRETPSAPASEASVWRVEAVRLEDDAAFAIGSFEREADARVFLEDAEDDLRDMTARQFQDRYEFG